MLAPIYCSPGLKMMGPPARRRKESWPHPSGSIAGLAVAKATDLLLTNSLDMMKGAINKETGLITSAVPSTTEPHHTAIKPHVLPLEEAWPRPTKKQQNHNFPCKVIAAPGTKSMCDQKHIVIAWLCH